VNYDDIAKWSQIISALVFYAVLVWMWIKFLAPALKTAQENQNRVISEAERHRNVAQAALEALRHDIDGAKQDAKRIRARAEEQARGEATAIVDEARLSGERMLRNAQGEIDRARAEGRNELRASFAEKALELARKDAQARIDGNLNAKLVNAFTASLERGAKN
jgi:F-type H+-transporting ATPase subunit b